MLVLFLFMGLIVASVFPWRTERQMSAYGDRWNDISSFRSALEADGYEIGNILSSPTVLVDKEDWREHVLVIAGVERPYTEEEIQALRGFVDGEGRLVLADDYGFAGPLLREFVGDVFLNGSRLYSSSYVKNPAFVRVKGLLDREYDVLLNRPTALQGVLPGYVLMATDNRTWMDVNSNNEKDIEEPEGAYVIGMRFANNIFLSDPSIFINDMWKREDNSDFCRALIRSLLPGGGKVIFDESVHVSTDAGARAQKVVYDGLLYVSHDNMAKTLLIVISILGVMAYLRYVKLPSDWYHRDNLNEPWLLNYLEPEITPSDNLRVKDLLEERVRVAVRMSRKEFALRRKAIIDRLIDDMTLRDFLTKWKTYSKAELEDLVRTISRWRPKDDLVADIIEAHRKGIKGGGPG